MFTIPAKEGPEKAGCSTLPASPPLGLPSLQLSPSRLPQLKHPFPRLVLLWDGGR